MSAVLQATGKGGKPKTKQLDFMATYSKLTVMSANTLNIDFDPKWCLVGLVCSSSPSSSCSLSPQGISFSKVLDQRFVAKASLEQRVGKGNSVWQDPCSLLTSGTRHAHTEGRTQLLESAFKWTNTILVQDDSSFGFFHIVMASLTLKLKCDFNN